MIYSTFAPLDGRRLLQRNDNPAVTPICIASDDTRLFGTPDNCWSSKPTARTRIPSDCRFAGAAACRPRVSEQTSCLQPARVALEVTGSSRDIAGLRGARQPCGRSKTSDAEGPLIAVDVSRAETWQRHRNLPPSSSRARARRLISGQEVELPSGNASANAGQSDATTPLPRLGPM